MKEIKLKSRTEYLYDRRDLIQILGLSRRTIQRAQQEGRLKSRVLGRIYYTSESEVEEFLQLRRR